MRNLLLAFLPLFTLLVSAFWSNNTNLFLFQTCPNIAIENLIEVVKEASKAILKTYNNSHLKVTQKADDSPLTSADIESNNIICSSLEKMYPDIPILSEEMPEKKRQSGNELCWIVNPLDGTKEFIKKTGEFTVNIGLSRKGHPILGLVAVPVSGDIYYGCENNGAYRISNNVKSKLSVSRKLKNLTWVGSKSHGTEEEKN